MRLRRFIISAISLALLFSAAPGVALADDSFSADGVTLSNIRINPELLPGDGQVNITVNIAVNVNRADGGIANVRVSGGGVSSGQLDSISIGDNADLQFSLNVQASQLGKQIPLTLIWDGNDTGITFNVTVGSSAPTEPQVTFTRTLDSTSVEQGGKVSIIYTIKNTGSIDVTDIVVTDDGVDSDLELKADKLSVGNSISLPFSHTVTADFTSTPKLTFKANGTAYTATCPAKSVTLRVSELEAKLSVIAPDPIMPGDDVTLVLDLANTGNVKFTNIVISEKTLGNKLFSATSLDKGEKIPFSKNIKLTQTAKFQYEISAKDESGKAYTIKSNELEVVVSQVTGQYDIEIIASPDAIRLGEPGKVTFEIVVTNKGTEPVANVIVTNQDNTELKKYESLPVGVTKFTIEQIIDKTTSFNFTLTAPAADGTYTRATKPLEIVVAEEEATPSAEPTIDPTAEPAPTGTDTSKPVSTPAASISNIVLAMLVVGGLIVLTAIVLVMMIVSDKLKKKRR